MMPKLLRIKEVQKIIGFSQATIYRLMASGDFPKPIHLAARTTAWLESDIKDFIMQKAKARG